MQKIFIKQKVKIICREAGENEIACYVLPDLYEYKELNAFGLRSRYNPELRYYAVLPEALTEEQTPKILSLLKTTGECSVATEITLI